MRHALMVLRLCVIGAAALAATMPAGAQVLPPPPSEMEALAWLEGEWEGSGWMRTGERRSEFEGRERVERRMGGRLLVVEGAFTASLGPGAEPVPVHEAFGVFSYDPSSGYVFRTYTARGGHGDANHVEVSDGRIVWGYEDAAYGRVRYTITRTDGGAWHEVGHASRDGGASWYLFLEMTLIPVDGD